MEPNTRILWLLTQLAQAVHTQGAMLQAIAQQVGAENAQLQALTQQLATSNAQLQKAINEQTGSVPGVFTRED